MRLPQSYSHWNESQLRPEPITISITGQSDISVPLEGRSTGTNKQPLSSAIKPCSVCQRWNRINKSQTRWKKTKQSVAEKNCDWRPWRETRDWKCLTQAENTNIRATLWQMSLYIQQDDSGTLSSKDFLTLLTIWHIHSPISETGKLNKGMWTGTLSLW